MFSGIIRQLGKIKGIKKGKSFTSLQINAGSFAKGTKPGDSLAVDGVCLTVLKKNGLLLTFEIIPQTWDMTRFKYAKSNDTVNLEKALKFNGAIDGHLLMGHVDGVATVASVVKEKNLRCLQIDVPAELRRFIALRGGIAVNGVSLTVSHLDKNTFSVSLIDYTSKNTNLGQLKKGSKVNLEVDMVGRYLDNLLKYESPRGYCSL